MTQIPAQQSTFKPIPSGGGMRPPNLATNSMPSLKPMPGQNPVQPGQAAPPLSADPEGIAQSMNQNLGSMAPQIQQPQGFGNMNTGMMSPVPGGEAPPPVQKMSYANEFIEQCRKRGLDDREIIKRATEASLLGGEVAVGLRPIVKQAFHDVGWGDMFRNLPSTLNPFGAGQRNNLSMENFKQDVTQYPMKTIAPAVGGGLAGGALAAGGMAAAPGAVGAIGSGVARGIGTLGRSAGRGLLQSGKGLMTSKGLAAAGGGTAGYIGGKRFAPQIGSGVQKLTEPILGHDISDRLGGAARRLAPTIGGAAGYLLPGAGPLGQVIGAGFGVGGLGVIGADAALPDGLTAAGKSMPEPPQAAPQQVMPQGGAAAAEPAPPAPNASNETSGFASKDQLLPLALKPQVGPAPAPDPQAGHPQAPASPGQLPQYAPGEDMFGGLENADPMAKMPGGGPSSASPSAALAQGGQGPPAKPSSPLFSGQGKQMQPAVPATAAPQAAPDVAEQVAKSVGGSIGGGIGGANGGPVEGLAAAFGPMAPLASPAKAIYDMAQSHGVDKALATTQGQQALAGAKDFLTQVTSTAMTAAGKQQIISKLSPYLGSHMAAMAADFAFLDPKVQMLIAGGLLMGIGGLVGGALGGGTGAMIGGGIGALAGAGGAAGIGMWPQISHAMGMGGSGFSDQVVDPSASGASSPAGGSI
jgi:hypothetical protein